MKATVTITSASLMALMLTGCVTITSDAGTPRLANGVRPQHPIYRTYAYKDVSSNLPVGQANFVEQADDEVTAEQADPIVEQTSNTMEEQVKPSNWRLALFDGFVKIVSKCAEFGNCW